MKLTAIPKKNHENKSCCVLKSLEHWLNKGELYCRSSQSLQYIFKFPKGAYNERSFSSNLTAKCTPLFFLAFYWLVCYGFNFRKYPFRFCSIYFIHSLIILTRTYAYLPNGPLSNMDLIWCSNFEQSRLFTVFCMINRFFIITTLAFAVVIMTKVYNRIETLLWFRNFASYFTGIKCIILTTVLKNNYQHLAPFYRGTHWSSERLMNLNKVRKY